MRGRIFEEYLPYGEFGDKEVLEILIRLKDEEIEDFVYEVMYQYYVEFIYKKVIPSLLRNEFVSIGGIGGDIGSVEEYLRFVDDLVGREGFGERKVKGYIKRNIGEFVLNGFVTEEEVRSRDINELVDEIYEELDVDDVIDILYSEVMSVVEKKPRHVEDWVNNLLMTYYVGYIEGDVEMVMSGEADLDVFYNYVKDFGLMRKLRGLIERKRREIIRSLGR